MQNTIICLTIFVFVSHSLVSMRHVLLAVGVVLKVYVPDNLYILFCVRAVQV